MAETARTAVVWRYLPGRKVRHALRVRERAVTGHDPESLCGTGPLWYGPDWEWRGTGSQVEYETVERLRECRRCAALVCPEEVARDGTA